MIRPCHVAKDGAAHLRGLGGLIPHEHQFYATVRRRPRRADVKVRVRREIPPSTWEIYRGMPVHTVPAIIDDLLGDHEDESAVAQLVRDAIGRGLVRKNSILKILKRHARAYGHSTPEEFLCTLTGEATRP